MVVRCVRGRGRGRRGGGRGRGYSLGGATVSNINSRQDNINVRNTALLCLYVN